MFLSLANAQKLALLLLSIFHFNILKKFFAKIPLFQSFLHSVLGKHPDQVIEGNSKDFKNLIK